MAAGTIDHGDRKQACSVLVPRSDITIVDDWHVIGLAGTGSKTFVIEEKFVPAHRILDKKASDEGNAPGAHLYAAPVFHMPRGGPSSRALRRSRSASRKGCWRPITNTRGRGNRAASRGRDWPARRSRRRPRRRDRGRGAHVSGRAARGDGRAGTQGAVHQAPPVAGQAQHGLRGAARDPRGAAALQRRRRARALSPTTSCSGNSATRTPPPRITR